MALPNIMVAPNGARLGKADHPALPVTLPEICETAAACFAAGADGLHLHIRDDHGGHLLDAGKYHEALTELGHILPDMAIQITSESAGIYSPDIQRQIVLDCAAASASVSVKEMAQEANNKITRFFYQECNAKGITIQHIIYEPKELNLLEGFLPKTLWNDANLQLLFVLGRYGPSGASGPETLDPFLTQMKAMGLQPDWAACAFGKQETNCLLAAHQQAGKIRVGFENSTHNRDGSTASSNAERVQEIVTLVSSVG